MDLYQYLKRKRNIKRMPAEMDAQYLSSVQKKKELKLISYQKQLTTIRQSQITKVIINRPKPSPLSFTSYLSLILLFTAYPRLLALVWPTLLNTFPQIPLFILIATSINLGIFVGYSVLMYFVYTGKYAVLEQYRVGNELWPWEKDGRAWRKLVRKTLVNVFVNICLIAPTMAYFDCNKSFPIKMSMEQIPTYPTFTYIWQFTFFLLCNQFWSYIMHAVMHHPYLYWIHKAHHQYSIPVSISGMYVHPLQYVLSSSISTCIGYKILSSFYPVHVFSFIIWLTFRNIEINDSHSGYNWPWAMASALPFGINEDYHYFHHRVNQGNFGGILTVMDDLFGSNREYYKFCANPERQK